MTYQFPEPAPPAQTGPPVVPGVSRIPDAVGAATAVSREVATIQGSVMMAKQYPRNDEVTFSKLMASCRRPSFADGATYSFPRGGKTVKGPSVGFAREAARIMGNMRWGVAIVQDEEAKIHLQGWAWDLENNSFVVMDDKFQKLIQRKIRGTDQTQWIVPDERDLRELVNRRGAIAERNAILKLVPGDVIEAGQRECAKTLRSQAEGLLKDGPDIVAKRIADAFSTIGVTVLMLETYVGHDLKLLVEEEVVKLKQVWRSIHDGNSTRDEYFDIATMDEVKKPTPPPNTVTKEDSTEAKPVAEKPPETLEDMLDE